LYRRDAGSLHGAVGGAADRAGARVVLPRLTCWAEGEAAGLLKILARRGLEMTDGERARILSTRDLSLLDRWYEVALSVASVRELLELEAVQPPH
jgi:hypothetical protein